MRGCPGDFSPEIKAPSQTHCTLSFSPSFFLMLTNGFLLDRVTSTPSRVTRTEGHNDSVTRTQGQQGRGSLRPSVRVTRTEGHQDTRTESHQEIVIRTEGHQDIRSPGQRVIRRQGHQDRGSSGQRVSRTEDH